MVFVLIIWLSIVLLSSCAEEKKINNVVYKPYGLLNPEVKSDSVEYSISAGSVICAIVFSETLIAPVYIVGWDLYEPTKLKSNPK